MKRIYILAIIIIAANQLNAQAWSASGGNLWFTSGNVGIGTSTPTYKLHVVGLFSLNKPALMQDPNSILGVPTGRAVSFAPSDLSPTNNSYLSIKFPTNNSVRFATDYDGYLGIGTFRDIEFGRVNGGPYLIIKDGGNVGIGTATPNSYKLAVEGTIGARAVRVTLLPWSDYVFYSDYNLMPISEVEKYINVHKHLPNIPTQEEVKKNGIDLGQMDASLLRKIEELTLYVIELKKENEAIKNVLQSLERK